MNERISFYYESNSKINSFFCVCEGGGRGGAGVNEFSLLKIQIYGMVGLMNPNLKKSGWKGGGWGGVDGRTDEQAHINLLFQRFRSWGRNNA